jgi:hypothetical protein
VVLIWRLVVVDVGKPFFDVSAVLEIVELA